MAKRAPFGPVNLSLITFLAPPKFPNQDLNIIAKSGLELEATHGESGDCLDHSFEENFMTHLGEKLFFPALELNLDPFFNVE